MLTQRRERRQQSRRCSVWWHPPNCCTRTTSMVTPLFIWMLSCLLCVNGWTLMLLFSDAFTINTISSFSASSSSSSVYSGQRSFTFAGVSSIQRVDWHPATTSQNSKNDNDDDEIDDHRTGTSNEKAKAPETTTSSISSTPTNRRRQPFRNFFRRFYNNNNIVTVVARKLILRFTRRDDNSHKESNNESSHKTLIEESSTNEVAVDGMRNVTSSAKVLNSLRPTATTAILYDYRNDLEQWNGKWNVHLSDQFLNQYDTYLQHLGQPYLVRSIAKNIIGGTTEETSILPSVDDDSCAPSIILRTINARGVWERTLVASDVIEIKSSSVAAERKDIRSIVDILSNYTYPKSSINTTVVTADNERVTAEARWIIAINDSDTVRSRKLYHHSWLRGVTKYGGGDFESIRYLEEQPSYNNNTDDNDDNHHDHPSQKSSIVLVCHSTFHPSNPQQRELARVTWRFRRIE